jgi:hypothetical protein
MPRKKSDGEIKKMVDAQAKGKKVAGPAKDRKPAPTELDERMSKLWKWR